MYELLLDFYQTHFAQETPQTQRDQTDKLLFVFEQKPSYPVLRFSVVNNSTRNVQIADIRAFKVASMKDNHTRSEEIMGKRVILNFNLTSATEGKGVGLLQGQVSNLAPGEAEAFELKLESENAVALVDFEAEYIAMSAKVPIKSRSQDAALVHAPTKQDNGQIMVLSRARLFESIFSEDANLSWSAPSYKSCGTHWMTLIRGAVTLTFHDSDAGWKRLKSKFENTEYFSLILASYADGLEQGFVSTFIASRLSEWISDPEKLRRLSAIDLEAPAFTISRALANRGVKFSSGAVSSQDFPCAYEISLLERLLEVSTIIDEPDDDEDNERRWGHNISKILGHASSNTMRADPAGKIAAEVQTEATEFLVATVIVQPQISHELDRVLRAVLKIKGEPEGYDDESV